MQLVATKVKDEIELSELIGALWKGKYIIILLAAIFSTCGVLYSLSLPNIYKSNVLLVAAEEGKGGGLSKLNSQFGGLASMAGINLGSTKVDKSDLALEIIKSRVFISEFIKMNELKVAIMAAENWDLLTNKLIYDEDLYNFDTGVWVREAEHPRVAEPSEQEVYDKFIKEHLSISTDKKSGLTNISIFHVSPFIAKDIADKLVISINNKIKADDILEADKSIQYLTSALQETAVADMQKIFYELIEQQEQTKMLANARSQYVFKVIDPAVVAELKDSPKRAVICAASLIFGVILGCCLVLVFFFINKSGKTDS